MNLQDKQAILTVQEVLRDIVMGLSNIKLTLPHDETWGKLGKAVTHIDKANDWLKDIV